VAAAFCSVSVFRLLYSQLALLLQQSINLPVGRKKAQFRPGLAGGTIPPKQVAWVRSAVKQLVWKSFSVTLRLGAWRKHCNCILGYNLQFSHLEVWFQRTKRLHMRCRWLSGHCRCRPCRWPGFNLRSRPDLRLVWKSCLFSVTLRPGAHCKHCNCAI
jgi:hypothetical protein